MKLVGEGLLMSEVVRPEAQIIVMFLLQKKQKKTHFLTVGHISPQTV